MTRQLYQNNSASTIAANVAATDTTIQVALGAMFPTPTGTDFFLLTLEKAGAVEIVRCTSRVGNALTVERAQEGTTATTFSVGDLAEMRITAGTLDVVRQEIIDARSPDSSLKERLENFSRGPVTYAITDLVGRYFDNLFLSSTTNGSITQDRLYVVPYRPHRDEPAERLGLVCMVAAAGAVGRVVIYDSLPNGRPRNLVFSGATSLDFSSTGIKEHAQNFTYEAGRLYWVGVHAGGATCSILCANVSNHAPNLSVFADDGSGGNYYDGLVLFSTPYVNGPPAVFPELVLPMNLQRSLHVCLRMRRAA